MSTTGKTFETDSLIRRSAFIPWRWVAIAAVLIISLIIVTLLVYRSRGSAAERGTRALIDAFSKRRLIEPRLSGGFKGGEFNPSRDDNLSIKTEELDRARELIMDSVAKGDSAAQIAYARLLLSAREKPQEAVKYLQRALAASPESAEAHNDMGVCLIEQGKIEGAIDEFETALKYKTDMPEGLYNRALCYQKLQLCDASRNDLIRLANIERDKGWFEEINARIGTLSSPRAEGKSYKEVISAFDRAIEVGDAAEARRLASESSELLRRHVLIELCVQQLESSVSGEPKKSERYMSAIDSVGETFEIEKNDRQISDAARYLRALPENERAVELALIRDYAEALRAFEANRPEEAQLAFERLAKAFERRRNSVFAETSSLLVAQCHYKSKRIALSVEVLQECLRRIEGRSWTYHRARVLTQLAIGYSRLGRDSLAIKVCEEALSLCPNVPELQAKILQFISLPYWHVGDLDTALTRLRDSTRLYLESALPGKVSNLAYNYYQCADIYGIRGKHGLALLNAQQALDYSEQAEDYYDAAEYASVSALAHARLDRFDEAESDLKRAFEYAARLQSGKRRDATEAFISTNEGEIAEIEGDLQRALDCYAAAEAQMSRDEGNVIPKINVLRGRAEAYTASAQVEDARSSLMQAVALIESYRMSIESSDQRSEFLNASQGVFDKLIWLDAATLGRSQEAFDMCERSRARTLLEEMSGTNIRDDRSRPTAVPLTLLQVQSQLAPGLMLLEYSVTSDGVLLFLVTNSTFEVVRLLAKAEELDARVADYVSDIRSLAPMDEVGSKARALYATLLEPASRYLDSHTLCVVPDKSLHFLPFGALVDASGKYVVETKAITYAPSSTTLIACDVRGRSKPSAAHERMLAVGNPQFNRDAFSHLEPLSDAAVEAREVAAAYQPNAIILTDAEASEPAVRSALRSCNVAHFAVHCLVEETSPWLAALVLADPASAKDGPVVGPGSTQQAPGLTTDQADRHPRGSLGNTTQLSNPADGMLYLDEVYKLRLPNTRIVVLSACESGLGRYYRGEGIVSLVRPFLAAGVPTVVPSLWRVSSAATAQLMISFQKERKKPGLGAAKALSAAQKGMAVGGSFQHPYYWAAFIVVGANN